MYQANASLSVLYTRVIMTTLAYTYCKKIGAKLANIFTNFVNKRDT